MEIFIACPKDTVTGGVELLHQFCYQLNTHNNVVAYIWYFGPGEIPSKHPIAYDKYKNPIANFNPSLSTILVFPEIYISTALSDRLKHNRKIIYWESVDNYYRWIDRDNRLKFPDNTIHLAQSYYALDFLLNIANINKSNIIYVTDYLNSSFLEAYDNKQERKYQVLYNPVKGLEFTKRIINSLPTIDFIPIENMTVEQVRSILRESMLYIDFGDFPGKDRIPREAVISGCCIITNYQGAAKFKEDVNIPELYKFERNTPNVKPICSFIKYVLDNYDVCTKDFEDYRADIRREYQNFIYGVNAVVKRLS